MAEKIKNNVRDIHNKGGIEDLTQASFGQNGFRIIDETYVPVPNERFYCLTALADSSVSFSSKANYEVKEVVTFQAAHITPLFANHVVVNGEGTFPVGDNTNIEIGDYFFDANGDKKTFSAVFSEPNQQMSLDFTINFPNDDNLYTIYRGTEIILGDPTVTALPMVTGIQVFGVFSDVVVATGGKVIAYLI